MEIESIEILKRTFEGKHNAKKNDDALTSKYSVAKKWILRYRIVGCPHTITKLFRTKKLAQIEKNLLENGGGKRG